MIKPWSPGTPGLDLLGQDLLFILFFSFNFPLSVVRLKGNFNNFFFGKECKQIFLSDNANLNYMIFDKGKVQS